MLSLLAHMQLDLIAFVGVIDIHFNNKNKHLKNKKLHKKVKLLLRKSQQTKITFFKIFFFIDFLLWKEEVKTVIYTMIYSSSKYIQIQYLTLILIIVIQLLYMYQIL